MLAAHAPTAIPFPGLAAPAVAAIVLATFNIVRWWNHDRAGNKSLESGVASSYPWGWNRTDALPQDLPRDAYLNHLAVAAEAWFDKRLDDRAALNERMTEFRQGCSKLIRSPHQSLAADDRAWLVSECARSTENLGHLVVILASGDDVMAVRNEVDQTISTLIAAILQPRGQSLTLPRARSSLGEAIAPDEPLLGR